MTSGQEGQLTPHAYGHGREDLMEGPESAVEPTRLNAILHSLGLRMAVMVGACVLVPVLVLIAWLFAHSTLPREVLLPAGVFGITALFFGIALALWLAHQAMCPLRQVTAALDAYERDGQRLLAWLAARSRGDELGRLLWGVQRCLDSVHAARRELEQHALEDTLTSALNRRGALQSLQASVAAAFDSDGSFVLVVADLDNLKKINDEYGHAAGDLALASITLTAREHCLQPGDWVGRWGGDEFLLGLHGDSQKALERIGLWIEILARPRKGSPAVLLSAGAALLEPELDADALCRRADAAMYQAKFAGGRRLCIGDETSDQRQYQLDWHQQGQHVQVGAESAAGTGPPTHERQSAASRVKGTSNNH